MIERYPLQPLSDAVLDAIAKHLRDVYERSYPKTCRPYLEEPTSRDIDPNRTSLTVA